MRNFFSTLITIIITAALAGGGIYIWQNTLLQETEKASDEQIQNLEDKIDSLEKDLEEKEEQAREEAEREAIARDFQTQEWTAYSDSENGISFAYPENWNLSANEESPPGASYETIARVVNPERAGVPDTDIPLEQMLIQKHPGKSCQIDGEPTIFQGYDAVEQAWEEGFGLIYYRTICVERDEKPVYIVLSAFDDDAIATMDKMVDSFEFLN